MKQAARADIDLAYHYFHTNKKRTSHAHECLNIIFLESLLGFSCRKAASLDETDVRYMLAFEKKASSTTEDTAIDFWVENIQTRLDKKNYTEASNILVETGLLFWAQKNWKAIQTLLGQIKIPQEEKKEISHCRTQQYIYFLTHYILIATHYGKLKDHSEKISKKVQRQIESFLPFLSHVWFWGLKTDSYLEIIFEIYWVFLLLVKSKQTFVFPVSQAQYLEMSQDTLQWIHKAYSSSQSKSKKKNYLDFHSAHRKYHQAILALFVLQEAPVHVSD